MIRQQLPQGPSQDQSPRLDEVQCKNRERENVQMDRPETKQGDEQNYEINLPHFHRRSVLGPGITPRAGHTKLCTGFHNSKQADTLKSDSAQGNMGLGHQKSRHTCQEPPLCSLQLHSCFL